MISSVIPGGIPLLLPNAALRVQVSLSKIVSQGVNDYQFAESERDRQRGLAVQLAVRQQECRDVGSVGHDEPADRHQAEVFVEPHASGFSHVRLGGLQSLLESLLAEAENQVILPG